MKRVLLAVAVLGVLVLAAVVTLVITSGDPLVKNAIETYGSEMTGVEVRVGRIEIDLVAGRGTIWNLTIGNPDGFESARAFSLAEITLDIDVESLVADPLRIDAIDVVAPEVTYEINASARSNIQTIRDNLDRYWARGDPAEPEASDDVEQPRFRIMHFTFEKGQLKLRTSAVGGKDASIELAPLRMGGLGRGGASTAPEIGRAVLTAYTKKILKLAARNQLDKTIEKKLGAAPGEAAKKLLRVFD